MRQLTADRRQESPPPRRPGAVTYLAYGVLTFGAINLVRLVQSLQQWDYLASLPGVRPLYTAVTGGVWAVVLTVVFWGLWTGQRWAKSAALAAVPLYLLYFWLDRLVFVNPYGANGRDPALPFFAGLTVVILLYLILALRSKAARSYFGELHDR